MSAGAPEETDLRVMLARVETKVDVVIDQHGREIGDHEKRLRVVEQRATVSPKQLATALVAAVGVIASIAPFLDRLYS